MPPSYGQAFHIEFAVLDHSTQVFYSIAMQATGSNASSGTIHQILQFRPIGAASFVLRFERNDIQFTPGQFLSIGLPGSHHAREYSIYSPATAPWLEILVRRVEHGLISPRLSQLRPGNHIRVEGPFGFFTTGEFVAPATHHLMIASGTGISPFHSMVLSQPHLNFTLLHGVRVCEDCFDAHEYPVDRYLPCVSRESGGYYHGRVTDFLRTSTHLVQNNVNCYLSGNCDMIYETYDLLTAQGIPSDRIKAEVYF